MNPNLNLIENTDFELSNSKWYGKFRSKPLRIALCIYKNDTNIVSIPISSISAYIKKYNKNIEIKLFHILQIETDDKYSPKGFSEYLKNWKPDLFATSILSTHWEGVQPYLTEIKNQLPETPILIGGYQTILKSDETINFPAIDFLCDGDGEIPTSELINYLRGETFSPVNGLWEKLIDGSIYKTPKFNLEDISTIPFPDYEIYEVNGKIIVSDMVSNRLNKRVLPVMTGRGCLYNCTYCSNSTLRKMWPNKKTFLRKYELEPYLDELLRLKNKYYIEYFEFWDELFLGDLTYAFKFFERYKDKINLPFSIVSRIEVMDYELCEKAAKAGCEAIYFGLESGNEEYRRKYLKRFDKNEQVLLAAENCKKVGINRVIFNIIGMPFETKSQMLDTLELNKQINPEYFYIFTYIPLKGTKLYDIAEENGLLYESLRTIHYIDNMYTGRAKMNIKQVGDSATEEEFNEVCKLLVEYQDTRQKNELFNKYEEAKKIDTK